MTRKDYTFHIGEKLWEDFQVKLVQENAARRREKEKIISQSKKIRSLVKLYLDGEVKLPEVPKHEVKILAGTGLDLEDWKTLKKKEIDSVGKGKINIARVIIGMIYWYVNKK